MLEWTHGNIVDEVFSESITMPLVGRPLQALVEDPYPPGDVEIISAVRFGETRTEIEVKANARPITLRKSEEQLRLQPRLALDWSAFADHLLPAGRSFRGRTRRQSHDA